MVSRGKNGVSNTDFNLEKRIKKDILGYESNGYVILFAALWMLTISGDQIHPYCLGSWQIGGSYTKNDNGDISSTSITQDEKEISGIKHTLDRGSNYIDICHHYGYGKSIELIACALQGYDRKKLFINAKLEIHHQSTTSIKLALEQYLVALNTEYIDTYQIHGVMQYLDHATVIATVGELIDTGKVRGLSISNFNKEQILEAHHLSAHGLVSHEINYNLVTRVNEENGVVDTCQAAKIPLIIYQPLKRNLIATANYPLLLRVAQKYGKTQNQILLNWLCMYKKYSVLCKSTDAEHIDENMSALLFSMETDDYILLDQFRPDNYQSPSYDYRGNDPSKQKIWKL